MDSITQATLGATVAEAILGKKAGYKAAAWGVVLGTIPDLDILLNPFLDAVGEIRYHRSFTHSIFFCLMASPVFGWLIDKIHKRDGIGWYPWAKLAFFVFLTHIMIDTPTTYGTQILFPLSDTPFTTDSIFIIDPLYTVPLLLGVVTAQLLKRSASSRRIINYAGLAISSAYLIWGLGIKSHVHTVFDASFQNQIGHYERMKTTPNGPTTFLWNGYIIKNDTIYHSIYSIFDESTELEFSAIPRRSYLMESHQNDRAFDTLLWFSRGYYTVNEENGTLYFYDLRFGRGDLWLTDEAEFVWRNEVLFDEEGRAHSFEQSIPSFDTRARIFSTFGDRIWGE